MEVHGVKFDKLIKSLERVENEQEPVDEVVSIFIGCIGVIFAILHQIGFHGSGVEGETTSK